MRNQGNPHARADTRQTQRRADVTPAQGKAVPSPRFFGARYRLGAAIRPQSIVFDNGFLDKFKAREPTVAERLSAAKWLLKLSVSESLRLDLADANQAYRHFHKGGGMPRTFAYENYVYNDSSGTTSLANAMLDIQDGAEMVWEADKSVMEFSITGGQISCGQDDLFPYPANENWQKAIGGHVIWLSGQVKVTERDKNFWFKLAMVLHAEDRYNFNPGALDIATGIPDSDNGIFEITGLGTQFDQTSELKRNIEWQYGTLADGTTSTASRPWR